MRLKPSQAVVLWRMLTAETDEIREPMWSKVRPKLSPDQRKELTQEGLVVSTRRGRANHLMLTQKAWHWAQESASVELGKSAEGTAALEALLRRLLPFLKRRGIQLLDILEDGAESEASSSKSPETKASAKDQILTSIRRLAQKAPSGGVRLVALRSALPELKREILDKALLALRETGLIILYPDDDRASLTQADHEAALLEGETPRHLVYLENR